MITGYQITQEFIKNSSCLYTICFLQCWWFSSRHIPLHIRIYPEQISRPLFGGAVNFLDGGSLAMWGICLGHYSSWNCWFPYWKLKLSQLATLYSHLCCSFCNWSYSLLLSPRKPKIPPRGNSCFIRTSLLSRLHESFCVSQGNKDSVWIAPIKSFRIPMVIYIYTSHCPKCMNAIVVKGIVLKMLSDLLDVCTAIFIELS